MSVITIDTTELKIGAEKIKILGEKLFDVVDSVLNTNMVEIEGTAKRLAPKDMGLLAGQISANTSIRLKKSISVNVFYAAYIEFGTGAYAAAYVASLPATWQQYAAQFRGKSGGTFQEMLKRLSEWVRRKGIATAKDANSVAYLIARSILRKGVKPHPFLYPAFAQQQPILIRDLEAAIKTVK